MPPSPPPSSGEPPAGASTLWSLAAASLLCGMHGLLLIGASSANLLSNLSYAPGFACGVMGLALGHRASHIAPGSVGAKFATAGILLSGTGVFLSLALFVLIVLALAIEGLLATKPRYQGLSDIAILA